MSEVLQNGNLTGEIRAEETLYGTIEAEAALEGSICMPKEKEVLKLANAPKISEVTLLGSAWVAEDKRHSQIVEIEGVTSRCQVDLTPDDQQLLVFYDKDVTFVTKNEGGTVTVIAIGQKPINDYIVQVTITEMDVQEGTTIWGVTVGTTMNPESIAAKVEVDGELSQMSLNAVQNKAVATKFAEVETTIGNIDVLLGTI